MKKNVFKRVTALLLVMIMALALSACGEKTAKNDGDMTTLVWYFPGDPQKDMQAVNDAINEIVREKIGVEVQINFIDQAAYQQRMNMMMASGEEFDLCHTGYALKYDDTINKGGLMEISEIIDKVTPDLWKKLPDYAKRAVERNGEIYGVPNIQIWAKIKGAIIRKDLADKYNLDLDSIHKIEDLEAFLQQVKDNEPSYYPLNVGTALDALDPNISKIYKFAYVDNETGEIFNYMESDYYLNRIKQMREWYQKGFIRADIATVGDESSDKNAGKYACEIGTYKPGVAEEISSSRGIEYVAVPLTTPLMTEGTPSSTIASVSATSKHPEEAVKLLYLVNTDKELYNLLCFGIEGKHYTKMDDGIHIEPIQDSGYFPNSTWKFGNIANAYLIKGEPADKWEATDKLNREAFVTPTFGFVFDTNPVRTEISQVATLQSEYSELGHGTVDVESTYAEYISRLKTGGMNEIYEEEVRQYNEWKASQK